MDREYRPSLGSTKHLTFSVDQSRQRMHEAMIWWSYAMELMNSASERLFPSDRPEAVEARCELGTARMYVHMGMEYAKTAVERLE
ncbi:MULTISPECIES: hypothetical protein [Dyella]|uniref:Uncharacterized protein n=2 Tax=Dyella TaxID=231454 RepID=A0A4R0YIZ4_9GAMM|nr:MULTISPECIES: hypothetical protein [Dyella]TBR36065.1 hypothetical protein EYV96_15775 [Dyella terrae]TCI06115.1 hypothetical protein EZM97_34870 [Dyella soli]